MNIKRTVSMLLVVLMLITAMPVTVFAEVDYDGLEDPTVTLASDDAKGGMKISVVDNNSYGVENLTVKVYPANKAYSDEAVVYTFDVDASTSRKEYNIPLGSATNKTNKIVADTEYKARVFVNPKDGYNMDSNAKGYKDSGAALAVNRISGLKITLPTNMEYNDGQAILFNGMKVEVNYYSVTDVTYTFDPSKNAFVNGNTVATDIKVMIGDEEVKHNETQLNVDDHHGKTLTVYFRTISQATTKTLTINGLLKAPSIKVTPNYVTGGIDYEITDENESGVNAYWIRFKKGSETANTQKVTNKKGTISKLDNVVAGETYSIDVYAEAKSNNNNSNWSASVADVLFSKKLTSLSVAETPNNMKYSSGEKFNATGLVVKFEYEGGQSPEKTVAFEDFEDYGITVSPAHDSVLKNSQNGTVITVSIKVDGKTITGKSDKETEALEVTGNITVPTITLAPDFANGGIRYTITCDDHSAVKYYEIELSNNNLYVTDKLTGNIPVKADKVGNEDLIIGNPYTATVTAYPKDTESGVAPAVSDVSNSAEAVSPATAFEIYTKPNDLTYKVGDALDYSGLSVKITFGNMTEYVFFEEFADYGITVSPANGTRVTSSTKRITVTFGTYTASFDISIGSSNVLAVTILDTPDDVSYNAGDKLNLTGLIVRVDYTDGDWQIIEYDYYDFYTAGITTSPSNGAVLKTTDDEVVVSCGGKSDSFDITVKSSNTAVTKVEIVTTPDNLIYDVNDRLDLDGITVKLTLRNGTVFTIDETDFEDYGIETDPTTSERLSASDTTVRVYYSDTVYDDFYITVGDAAIKSLSVVKKPTKLSYAAGDTPDYTGLVVRAYFNTAKTAYTDVNYSDFAKYNIKITPESDEDSEYLLTVEDTTVFIYYGTLNASDITKSIYTTFEISVKNKTIHSMEVYTQPTLAYQNGDTLDLSKLTVKVYYTADKKDFDIVPFDKFTLFGITASPANGTVLSVEKHNGAKVKLTAGTVSVETNAISIATKKITSIRVVNNPTNLEYNAGEKLSLAGLILELTYADGTKKAGVTYDAMVNYGITSSIAHGTALNTSHSGKVLEFTAKNTDDTTVKVALTKALSVVELDITEITVLKYTDTYAAGDTFDKDSLVILAKYASGSTGYLATENIIVDPRASLKTSDTSVTIYYGEFSKALNVYVYELDVYNMIKDWNGSKYTDVKEGQWFYQYMAYMSAVGAIDPTNAAGTTLGPADLVTRAMFVEMLYRIEGSPNVKVTGKFTDIPSDASYLKAAEWAYAAGITTGTSATAFSPNNTVTREQMVTFLYRYAQYKKCDLSASSSVKSYPDYKTITGYNDGKDSYGFVKAFEWAIAEGIINGASNAGVLTLNPQGIAMRSEAAKILTVFHIKFIAE